MRPDNSFISAKVFLSVKENGSEPLVAQQCRLLEQGYNTNFTSALLDEENACRWILSQCLNYFKQADLKHIRTEVAKKPSLRTLNHPICRAKLWDIARDHGIQGSRSLLVVITALITPIFRDL